MEFVYELVCELGAELNHGTTPVGQRLHVPIVGGFFNGPRLSGTVLPGGADWQIVRADGRYVLEAIYDMRCSDGTLIHVRNHGLWYPGTPGHSEDAYAMSQPRLEVPEGPHEWLNHRMFVAPIIDAPEDPPNFVRLHVYAIAMSSAKHPASEMPSEPIN